MKKKSNLPKEYQQLLGLLPISCLQGGVKIIKTTRKDGTEVYLLCLVTPSPTGGFGLSPIAEMIDVTKNAAEMYNNPPDETEEEVKESGPTNIERPLGSEEELLTIIKLINKEPERGSCDMLFKSVTTRKEEFMKFGVKAKLEALDTLIDFYGKCDEFEKCKTLLDIRHEIEH